MSIRALIGVAVLSLSSAAFADDATVAAPAEVTAPVEVAQPAEVAAPAQVSKGLFISAGFAYLPGGIDGPGDAAAGVTQVGWRMRARNIELRFSGIAAYEETYYQTSFHVMGLAQFFRYAGDVYSFGAGVGVGVGSYSPIGDYNADNGTTAQVLLVATPATLHLGPGHHIEAGVDVGALYLVAFNEIAPFFQLRGGYAF